MQKTLKTFYDYIKYHIFLLSFDFLIFSLFISILGIRNFYAYFFSKLLLTIIGYLLCKYFIFESQRKVFIFYLILVFANLMFGSLLMKYFTVYFVNDLVLKLIIDLVLFGINFYLVRLIFSLKF